MKIEQILLLKEKELLTLLYEKMGGDLAEGKYLYIENKESPIMIQAHVDTVRSVIPIIQNKNGVIKANDCILGADDRAGIFAIMKIHEHFSKKGVMPNILFTDGEEIMGTGMSAFVLDEYDFDHINLVLSLDRQGCGEYVTYNYLDRKVEEFVESFGFFQREGTFSDIEIFTDATLIPSVNLSIGYHYQHTKKEELHIDEMYLTINRVINMVNNPLETLYKSKASSWALWRSKEELPSLKSKSSLPFGWEEDIVSYEDLRENEDEEIDPCELCGTVDMLVWARDSGGEYIRICKKCIIFVGEENIIDI